MKPTVHGIHHVTCFCGDAQENLDFYVRVMGMRLAKRSVNQDDPGVYHLFYTDAEGTPGTDLTFFPWPQMAPGRLGTGMTTEVSFAVPPESLDYWQKRLEEHGVKVSDIETRFGEPSMTFQDPHGLPLALVETYGDRPFVPWNRSTVPEEFQLRGFHSVAFWQQKLEPTADVLTGVMDFTFLGEENGWHRYSVDKGGPGNLVDIKVLPDQPGGRWGQGTVHHVAWRTRDDEEELGVRERVQAAGLHPTELIDRFWFKSVYFREPGNVLFELATDGPGFAIDEDPERLGESLILPPWLEPKREAIEKLLPPLTLPTSDS